MDYREFLKTARGKKSQKKFADELGVNWDHYSKVERGQKKASVTWLEAVAEKLNADVVIEIIPRDVQQVELDLDENLDEKKSNKD